MQVVEVRIFRITSRPRWRVGVRVGVRASGVGVGCVARPSAPDEWVSYVLSLGFGYLRRMPQLLEGLLWVGTSPLTTFSE